MLYDITAKDLCKYYPVYTKAGFIWKNRINWEVIQVPGNKVKTYFGIFTFLRAYKVDKVWYWVLTDGTKTITVKRDQARKNKKLPKTATVQTTLMLAQPRELIDQLVEEVERLVQQYNEPFISNRANYTSRGKLKASVAHKLIKTYEQVNSYTDIFKNKIAFISTSCYLLHDKDFSKTIYKKLKKNYHPDITHNDTVEQFDFIVQLFAWL